MWYLDKDNNITLTPTAVKLSSDDDTHLKSKSGDIEFNLFGKIVILLSVIGFGYYFLTCNG